MYFQLDMFAGFFAKCAVLTTMAFSALLMQGCSPKDVNTGGVRSTVTIVRETAPEFPDKALAMYRELQQRCIMGRTVVANAQGWSYNPQADVMTDTQLLALDTLKTEEYFDGGNYAIIVSGNQIDHSNFGTLQENTCKLQSMPLKSVEIRKADCSALNVEYDLRRATGRIVKLENVCGSQSAPVIDQSGETVTVSGTNHQCKWNGNGNNSPLHVPVCSLLPNPIHAGTQRELIAIQKAPAMLGNAAVPLPGTTALTFQSVAKIERATLINVGDAIPAAKFEAPADSTGFTLSSGE